MKKKGMLSKFAVLFVVVIIFAVIINYVCATLLGNDFVLKEKQAYITGILDLVAHTMEEDGQTTLEWAEYCEKNGKDMDIDYDFTADPGEYRTDLTSGNGKLSEKERMEKLTQHWINYFDYALDTYGLRYMYFVRVTPEKDIVYVADGKPKKESRDGKFYRFTGDLDEYQDTPLEEENPIIWKLWNSGDKSDIECELSKTEYGYTYRLWSPVTIDGEVAGLLGANIDVSQVNAEIRRSTLPIAIWSCLFFAILLIFILIFLKQTIVEKIIMLNRDVKEYSGTKNISLVEKIKTSRYSQDEIGNLAMNFSNMILSLDTYMKNLNAVTAEKERIGAELDVARDIQASMLPCIFPAFPERKEFDIYATMEPAKEVGGDFYDFFLVDEGHLAMVMADVSGKGVAAALFMVIAKTLLKNRAQMGESPADVLEKVNNQLCENNDAEMFVTVWIGILDISTGVVTCANAGHEYPVIKRKNGDFELIKDPHGFVLAAMENMKYKEYELILKEGDQLYLYTDGVPESMNASKQFFGLDRMVVVLNEHKNCEPKELLEQVKKDIDHFCDEAPQFDDITMLAIMMKNYE